LEFGVGGVHTKKIVDMDHVDKGRDYRETQATKEELQERFWGCFAILGDCLPGIASPNTD
jgi:hypothetical protein